MRVVTVAVRAECLRDGPERQIRELRVPGKLLQYAAYKQQARDVHRGYQVLRAQIDKPAENGGIAAQLIE